MRRHAPLRLVEAFELFVADVDGRARQAALKSFAAQRLQGPAGARVAIRACVAGFGYQGGSQGVLHAIHRAAWAGVNKAAHVGERGPKGRSVA